MEGTSMMTTENETAQYIYNLAKNVGSPLDETKSVIKMQVYRIISAIISLLMLILCFLSIINEWNNINLRFQAIEDAVVLIFALSLKIETYKFPINIINKLLVIDGKTYDNYYNKDLKKQKELQKIYINEQKLIKYIFQIISLMFALVNGLLPATFSVIYLINTSDKYKVKNNDLFFPFECWLPFTLNTVSSYLLFLVIQMYFLLDFSFTCICWFTSTILSLVSVTSEIESLCISFDDIDNEISFIKNEITSDAIILDIDIVISMSETRESKMLCINNEEYQKQLKMYLRQIVRHHQTIIRTVKMLNDSLTWNILIFNQVCCVQFCLSLYGFFEREDMSSKIKYLLLMIPVFWCFTLFCWYGQQLTNASVKLFVTFTDCSWTNKPKWFQKNLCIVLLFSKHILQIMPLRLYALNFKNIMTVLQAAYSYFNLMHSLNQKINY